MATSIFSVVFIVSLIILVPRYMSYRRRQALFYQHDCKLIPNFSQSRFLFGLDVGYTLQQWLSSRTYLSNISRALSSHSTISLNIVGQRIIWTCDPENIQAILSSSAEDFQRSSIMQRAFEPLIPNGLVMTNGKAWEHGRKLLTPAFARAQISDLELYEQHFQELLLRLPADGTTVDLQPLFNHYTIDTASELLLGSSLHTLREDAPTEALQVEMAFDTVNEGCLRRLLMGPLMFLHRDKTFTHSLKVIETFFDAYINAAKKRAANKTTSKQAQFESTKRYVFLTSLLSSTTAQSILRDQLVTLMIAGRDTTASLMSLVFYFLLRHSTALQTLYAEISVLQNRPPNYAELQSLTYLRHVIRETQRLLPTVATIERSAIHDTYLPRGGGQDGLSPILVAKNQQIQIQIHALHHSSQLWGPDASAFRPSRWDPSGLEESLKAGWKFVPFGGGRRICPGQQLALNEVSYLIVRLLQSFPRVESRDNSSFEEAIATTISNRNGCNVALFRREEQIR